MGGRRVPKVVDHEERQREIAGAVWRAVARRGIEAATMREIADEAGFSTGVLAHYFEDKDALILHALHVSIERAAGRVGRRSGGATGLEALRSVLREGLPLDDERRGEMRVWINFWGRATSSEALGREQGRWYTLWRSVVQALLEECRRAGEVSPDLDAEQEAAALVALVDGIGIQATFESDRFPPEEQASLIERQLGRLAAR
ncbi:MAG: TetR family transcriptional regulator [Actinomycetota bacterium]|nr:TetR family transcriptional regulator [Actinomycetota bacterium]MDQ3378090.1 TetR family transcriptional regulator [Actinomycetota bacterium]